MLTTQTDSVVLTWHEAAIASHVGWMRQIKSLTDGRKDRHGFTGDGWSEHCEGACGELAVAKFLGIYWNGSIDTWKDNDLPGLQVRTRSLDTYGLIVRPNDSDDATWVLITGRCPTYRVRGWINGRDAKRPEWLANHAGRPPAYFVPAEQLNPMNELPRQPR